MLQTKNAPYPVPDRLPLLEGLCWNIADPYQLTPEQMLGIYEERWHFKDVLGYPSATESIYIQQLITRYGGLPLLDRNNQSKEDIFEVLTRILARLNRDLLIEHQAFLAGGALISLKYDQMRYSQDLDFLIEPKNYQQLKATIKDGAEVLTPEEGLKIGEPRIDRYGIRYPLEINCGDKTIIFKLEIVAEYSLAIDGNDSFNNIPCLNLVDRITSKLTTNADRWADRNKFSRDLIDLAIIASKEGKIPAAAITKATNIYSSVEKDLIQSIEQFQNLPDYRAECYSNLQISRPEVIANGLDYLAVLYQLDIMQRSFKETQAHSRQIVAPAHD